VPVIGAVAAVAAVVLIAIVASRRDGTSPIEARAAIAGKSVPSVTGEALLYGSNKDGGTVEISLKDVPPAPSGHHYEVWVLRSNAGAAMEAVGAFTPVSRNVHLDLALPGPGDYAAVDISVEENGGPPAHSDTSLASGTFS
jgi:anti-sigma-K factor RskA